MPALLMVLALAAAQPAPAMADERILYAYRGFTIRDGQSGPVARVQAAVNGALDQCGSQTVLTVDGLFGRGTRNGLAELATCPTFDDALPEDSPARSGALTTATWTLLF